MTINDIIDCFNKALNTHYVVYSNIERKIGAIKEASTIITKINKDLKTEEVIRESCTASIIKDKEPLLIEESQKKALIKFIEWLYDTGTK